MIFYNRIIVHPLADGMDWITEDWTAVLLDKRFIFIPQGFQTDFGSIARSLWGLVGAPATGKHRRAVLYHDALYQGQQCTRKEADNICLEIMRNDGAGFMKRGAIYYGVRLGGWIAWNRKTEESIKNYREMQKEQFNETDLHIAHSIYA